ncbi:hypothetical protein Tco_0111959, partial [Tanacetum coccineum]
MLAPKCATYNGRSTFANPKYLKKAQSEKPRLYEIPYDTSDPANRFCPNGEETVTLEKESRSKLDKDKVKPYDYTYQNSLYETFKPPSKTYLDQLERAKEVRKTMWRKTTSSTDSQMHNNIMAAGSKDRPPMLGPGRYSQWRSRFLRYIDTKPNGGGLKKCILNGPYVPTSVLIQAVPEAEGRPAVQQHTTIETVLNMTPENKEHFQSEKEAIFLLLTGIGDEIYSTVDACNTANEMWIAIERLQQGESRFYKLMNELTRNNLQVTTMQVNVQFLQQFQPEWSRFVTIVKQSENIDIVSYHRLFDLLKQFQLEVNDIRAERISKSANPLALIAA